MSRLTHLLAVALLGASAVHAAPVAPVDFSADVRPIISARCFRCHGPDESTRKAGLRLDTFEEATRPTKKGHRAVVPGKPAESELLRRVRSHDADELMPPPETKATVTAEEAALLERWIASGAHYSPHWAWQAPVRPPLPAVRHRGWARNGIDHFVLARLEQAGLKPSPPAEPHILARRIALDLTGLPPEPSEVDAFVADRSPGALDRYVDRLLASPHYGERWARVWLDLARYADSAGYGSDPLRPNIWPYRDWVIGAFNRNLPFDRFTVEQIAGDLLPGAGRDESVATAFHRNTMTNTEGGTDDEEWRVAAVKDRANVTAQAWMGLTMGCAQCHTHKFDPITQREYYGFYAFFNQTSDNDQPDESPTLPLFSPAEERRRAELREAVARLEAEYRAPNAAYDAELERWAAEAARPVPWRILPATAARSAATNGASLSIEADGAVRASGDSAERDQYLVSVRVPAGTTALRLEALADPSLPGKGPGRRDGNFVLNDLRAFAAAASNAPAIPARFLRVEGLGGRRQLAIAEAQVFAGGRNVAPLGSPRQSTTTYLADAAKALDGNPDGNVNATHSVSLTLPEEHPWWELDLLADRAVEEIALWARTDGGGGQLANTRVALLDASRKVVWETAVKDMPAPVVRLGPAAGRELRLREATADHVQGGFSAQGAIDGNTYRDSGWAVGGATGADHMLAFELAEPAAADTDVTLVMTFCFGERQALGRFRFGATAQPAPVRILPAPVAAAVAAARDRRTEAQRKALDDHYRPKSAALGPLARRVDERRRELDSVRGTPVPVMRELAAKDRRTTKLLNKGNYLDPGDAVEPTVPAAFHPFPSDAPRDRTGLARWLVDPANPLTARVTANRFWAQLMGSGIVETEEDFGTQGTLPTHRELLDWLAVSFQSRPVAGRPAKGPGDVALGWDMKALAKLIVTSATYGQSTVASPAAEAKDPRNRLLSHANRRRLDAESVRDQALAIGGLLSRRVGGPSVFPPQPDGLWRAAFNGERTWATSEGEDRYRRGIYTFLRRTVPYPSMATFDAPSREQCTLRRQPTNTPLQAFVGLNDPVFVEAAQGLARRLMRAEAATPADRIRLGLRWVTGRPAEEAQVATLLRLYEAERAANAGRRDEARRLATEPIGPLPPGFDVIDAAAWTAVGNVLLNLDAVLTRG